MAKGMVTRLGLAESALEAVMMDEVLADGLPKGIRDKIDAWYKFRASSPKEIQDVMWKKHSGSICYPCPSTCGCMEPAKCRIVKAYLNGGVSDG